MNPLLRNLSLCVALLVVLTVSVAMAGDASRAELFRAKLGKLLDKQADDVAVIKAGDGWLYLRSELRHLSVGKFWGEAAQTVSRASKEDRRDPMPAIVDFARQLKEAGIELIFVPVPAKAAIYPQPLEGLIDGVPAGDERLDAAHRAFFDELEAAGVTVLDLAPHFRKAAAADGKPLVYCKQDTHWSPYACELTADLLAERIREQAWHKDVAKWDLASERKDLTFKGDMLSMLGDSDAEGETHPARFVYQTAEDGSRRTVTWRESPVLLVGDSHNLVFNIGGDMHATGAGLADQLALELGYPVDTVGVRGSGATPSRIALYRRKDNLEGKKVVIWCLTVREFTEGDGWWKFQLIR